MNFHQSSYAARRFWWCGIATAGRYALAVLIGIGVIVPRNVVARNLVTGIVQSNVIHAPVLLSPALANHPQTLASYEIAAQGTTTFTMPRPITYFVPSAVKPIEFPEGTINVALLGVDTRPQLKIKNTDVIVIASINPSVPSVTMLSIPRDTLVYIPGRFVWKVNQAYANGGFDLFKRTIEYNFGIKIDHYAMVNFSAVIHAVEAVGGIDVVATCPIYHIFPKDPYYMGGPWLARDWTDNFSGDVWKAGTRVPTQTIDIPKPGVYQLNGLQALAFARARYGIPGGDVDRGRREQRVIRAIFAKAKQVGTLTKIPELLDTFNKDVQTDFVLADLLQLAGMADRINDTVIRSRFLDRGGSNGALWADAKIYNGGLNNQFWVDRRNYLEQTLKIALNQRVNESIPVQVLNGTNDPGFAAAAADRLNELGLRVVDIKPADSPYVESIVLDHSTTSKGSAIPLLQKTFNIKNSNILTAPAEGDARYTIVVGSDFNTCYFAKSLLAAGSEEILANTDPNDTNVPLPDTIDIVAPLATDTPEPSLVPIATETVAALTEIPVVPTEIPVPATPTAIVVTATPENTTAPTPTTIAELPVITETVRSTDRAFAIVPTGDFVNIRRGASTRTRVIGLLRSGQRAEIIGRSEDGTWWQVQFGGRQGWIAAEFVRTNGDTAGIPVQR